jgi:two-component system, sensor histidine kinase and response regulator
VRKHAKRGLRSNAQLFRSIFENAEIGVSFFDIESGEHVSNKALHRMLGYNEEELSRPEKWDRIVHPAERAAGAERYAALLQGTHEKDAWEQRLCQRAVQATQGRRG